METITVQQYKELLNKRNSKYKNRKTKVNGITFDSKAEAEFYQLLWTEKITHKRQVKYPIEVNGKLICYYYADFVFPNKGMNGKDLVIDVKGFETKDFKLKKKLMKAVHGIDVITVKKSEFGAWIRLMLEN